MAGYLYSIRPVFVIYFVQLDNDNLYYARSGPIPWVFSYYFVLFDIFVSCVFLFLFFNFSFDEELVFYSQVQLISVRRSCKKKIGHVTIRDAIHDPSWNSEEKRNNNTLSLSLNDLTSSIKSERSSGNWHPDLPCSSVLTLPWLCPLPWRIGLLLETSDLKLFMAANLRYQLVNNTKLPCYTLPPT